MKYIYLNEFNRTRYSKNQIGESLHIKHRDNKKFKAIFTVTISSNGYKDIILNIRRLFIMY